jgi:hypothetical protein
MPPESARSPGCPLGQALPNRAGTSYADLVMNEVTMPLGLSGNRPCHSRIDDLAFGCTLAGRTIGSSGLMNFYGHMREHR